MNCSISGWTANASKALIVGNSVEDACVKYQTGPRRAIMLFQRLDFSIWQECCTPLCGNSAHVTCPAGMAVKPEDENKTEAGHSCQFECSGALLLVRQACCQKQCKAHKCSDGWAADVSKATAVKAFQNPCFDDFR